MKHSINSIKYKYILIIHIFNNFYVYKQINKISLSHNFSCFSIIIFFVSKFVLFINLFLN